LLAAALAAAASLSAGTLDIAIARRLAEQAVTLARQLGTDPLLVDSLGTLSYVGYLAGDSGRGPSFGQEAAECARRLGDDVLLGESLANYLVWDDLIGLAHAGSLFAEAIAATTRSGDHLYASYVNNQAAVYALRTGGIPAARAYLEEAARAMQEIGDKGRHVLINLGWVLRRDNDPEEARSSFESALRASRRNGERSATAYASLGLACLAADAGDWERAGVMHGIAQALLDSTGQPWEELEASYREDSLAGVRANLGQEQFDRAYAEGMALSFDAAIDLATGKAHQPDVKA
jgi:tetratricopeptide (TPR) repeat protein